MMENTEFGVHTAAAECQATQSLPKRNRSFEIKLRCQTGVLKREINSPLEGEMSRKLSGQRGLVSSIKILNK